MVIQPIKLFWLCKQTDAPCALLQDSTKQMHWNNKCLSLRGELRSTEKIKNGSNSSKGVSSISENKVYESHLIARPKIRIGTKYVMNYAK